MNWHEFFFRHVYLAASKSKDPRTQIGAVLLRNGKNRTIISEGYNGFPRGVADFSERLEDRKQKLELIVHAELNAICNAARNGISTDGTILYTNTTPCNECAKPIIQAGIRVIFIHEEFEKIFWERNDWGPKHQVSELLLREANILIKPLSLKLGITTLIDGQKVSL